MALFNRNRSAQLNRSPGDQPERLGQDRPKPFQLDLSRIHQDDLRIIAALISMLIAGIVLTLLSFGPAPDSMFAIVMLDRQSPLYPMTVQNLIKRDGAGNDRHLHRLVRRVIL